MIPAAKMALLSLACCLLGARSPSAATAELKLQVQLDAGVIKVADLWDNAGPKAAMIVGPAPPPGRSISIETAQLIYIARLYDVDWRPTSGVERTSVERAGRALTRDDLEAPLRRGLIDAGASPDATVEINNFDPLLVPRMSFPQMSVETTVFDPASERFSANMVASADGMQTQRIRVTGHVTQMVSAVVAIHRLQSGEVIGPGDVRTAQIGERRLAGPVAGDIAQVVGQAPKRTIIAGQPLAMSDIGPPIMVAKGAKVLMMLDTPGLSLSAQGVALAPGGRDDTIQIMNPLSHAVVAARVAGPGIVTVFPGSTPVVLPANATPRSAEVAN